MAVGYVSCGDDVEDRRNETLHERGHHPAVPPQRDDGRRSVPGSADASRRDLQRRIDQQEEEINLRRRISELEKENRDLHARTAKLESTNRELETRVQQQLKLINQPRGRRRSG
jgi:septal ring factor EnvC (AmiA/AmiB activator)